MAKESMHEGAWSHCSPTRKGLVLTADVSVVSVPTLFLSNHCAPKPGRVRTAEGIFFQNHLTLFP